MASASGFSEAGARDSTAETRASSQAADAERTGAAPARGPSGSDRIYSTVGSLVVLFMRSSTHQSTTLADLRSQIMPAVLAGQYSIAAKRKNAEDLPVPVGAVLWARVSADLDARLSADPSLALRLSPPERTSGDIIWITECVGEAPVVKEMLGRLIGETWKGRTVRQRPAAARA